MNVPHVDDVCYVHFVLYFWFKAFFDVQVHCCGKLWKENRNIYTFILFDFIIWFCFFFAAAASAVLQLQTKRKRKKNVCKNDWWQWKRAMLKMYQPELKAKSKQKKNEENDFN